MIVTTTFQRKTFVVQAKQVKPIEMQDIAEWCGGTFIESYEPDVHMASGNYRKGHPCIEFAPDRVTRRVIRAFEGDWITHIRGSEKFKVYRDATFKEAFEEVLRDLPEEVMRRIVRQEMRLLLDSMQKTSHGLAHGPNRYDMDEIQRVAYQAIEEVVALEEAMMPHAWNCETRNPHVSGHKCSCGVGEDS